MQAAQLLSSMPLKVYHGDPVEIDGAPPGATFIMVDKKDGQSQVLSIDTGAWVASESSPYNARCRAEEIMRRYARHPYFIHYWNARCAMMDHFRAWVWDCAAATEWYPSNDTHPDFLVMYHLFANMEG